MSKKNLTITLDEKLIEKAKKHLPNISEFVEECLTEYLGLADGTYPTAEAKDIVDVIGKSQAKLFILNKDYDFKESQRLIEQEKLNRPWRALWNDYKRKQTINKQLMSDALQVLPVDAETLEDILDFADFNQEDLDLNFSWEEVYEKYQKEEEDS